MEDSACLVENIGIEVLGTKLNERFHYGKEGESAERA